MRRLTPVRTVAIDGGPPESRPCPTRRFDGEESTWLLRRLLLVASAFVSFSEKSRKSQRCRTSSRFRRRPTTNSCRCRSRRAGGPTRACRPCSSPCSRSRTSPTRRCSNSSNYEFEPPKYDVDECRQRGMTYRGAAQGDAAPHRVRYRRGNRREVGQGHQGAGRLHGRHPAHDQQRHVHRERHRARHRLADAPLARRVLRSRQGQDALLGQAAVRRPHHSVSRLVARHRVRRQGHRPRAYRPAPEDSGDVAAARARHGRRGGAAHLLQADRLQARQGRLARAVRCQPHARLQGGQRPGRRRHRQGGGRGRQEAHRAPGAPARREGPEGAARHRRGTGRPLHRRGPGQSEDRRDLRRGRRGDHREEPQAPQRGGLQGTAAARHRPRQCRRLHPQHAHASTRT